MRLRIDPQVALTVVRERVRFVDHEPYAPADSYFPEELVRGTPLMKPEDVSAPGGVLAASGLFRCDTWTRSLFACPLVLSRRGWTCSAGTPFAVHTRTGHDKDDRPLRVMVTTLPGDRHVIRYDLSAD